MIKWVIVIELSKPASLTEDISKGALLISCINIYNDMGFPGGDWAIISIDGAITRAKILHKSRGRYVI